MTGYCHEDDTDHEGFLDSLKVSGNRPVWVMPDEDAVIYSSDLLGDNNLDVLKAFPVKGRDGHIAELGRAGFSVRQIARLTGIGKRSFQRVSA